MCLSSNQSTISRHALQSLWFSLLHFLHFSSPIFINIPLFGLSSSPNFQLFTDFDERLSTVCCVWLGNDTLFQFWRDIRGEILIYSSVFLG
ncbi:hypothetical protein L2E82_22568 [Cichorium intybus]|uniref:Uncharacterized protein n=1 Tax=Cichorium intybus TaxID=13427 RepID=A0ACB9DZ34_CICIN|nr:hypothetical protein L2E82_22568 [Cichorium intybus]